MAGPASEDGIMSKRSSRYPGLQELADALLALSPLCDAARRRVHWNLDGPIHPDAVKEFLAGIPALSGAYRALKAVEPEAEEFLRRPYTSTRAKIEPVTLLGRTDWSTFAVGVKVVEDALEAAKIISSLADNEQAVEPLLRGFCRRFPEPVVSREWEGFNIHLSTEYHYSAGPSKKRGVSKGEANAHALVLLKYPKMRTVRALAAKIGCSTGLIGKLPAWKAYRARVSKEYPPPAPKAVSQTDAVWANEGRSDKELEGLIAEQTKDFEPSPLVSVERKRNRVHRRV